MVTIRKLEYKEITYPSHWDSSLSKLLQIVKTNDFQTSMREIASRFLSRSVCIFICHGCAKLLFDSLWLWFFLFNSTTVSRPAFPVKFATWSIFLLWTVIPYSWLSRWSLSHVVMQKQNERRPQGIVYNIASIHWTCMTPSSCWSNLFLKFSSDGDSTAFLVKLFFTITKLFLTSNFSLSYC